MGSPDSSIPPLQGRPSPSNINTQEWQTVKPRNNNKNNNNRRRSRKAPPSPSSSFSSRARLGSPRSLEDITAEYHRLCLDPPTQECCRTVRLLVRTNVKTCAPVDKAVCLGMGTFDPPDGAWEAKRRAYVQFLVFEALVQELESLLDTTIPCFFQEPLLTEADAAFLAARGHTVLPVPLASTAVTPHTLLYGIHLYRPLYEETLSNHLPSLFVGTGWETWEQLMLPDNALGGIKKMHETYSMKCEFPQEGLVFSGTWMYWRGRQSSEHGVHHGREAGETDDTQGDR